MTHGIGKIADDSVDESGITCSYCGQRLKEPDITPDYIFCPVCGKFFNIDVPDSAEADKSTRIKIYNDQR